MIARLFEQQLRGNAAYYRLDQDADRKQSARDLRWLFFSLLKGAAPSHFIEAGARDGSASIQARSVLPDSTIVAFEANPECVSRFSREMPHTEHRVDYRHAALGDHDGETTFHIVTEMSGKERAPSNAISSVLRPTIETTKTREVTVPLRRLDSQIDPASVLTCALWIDVEGYQKQVLTGAGTLLNKASLIVIEVDTFEAWPGQWMPVEVIECLLGAGLFPVARDFEYPHHYNIIFARDTVPKLNGSIERYTSRRAVVFQEKVSADLRAQRAAVRASRKHAPLPVSLSRPLKSIWSAFRPS